MLRLGRAGEHFRTTRTRIHGAASVLTLDPRAREAATPWRARGSLDDGSAGQVGYRAILGPGLSTESRHRLSHPAASEWLRWQRWRESDGPHRPEALSWFLQPRPAVPLSTLKSHPKPTNPPTFSDQSSLSRADCRVKPSLLFSEMPVSRLSVSLTSPNWLFLCPLPPVTVSPLTSVQSQGSVNCHQLSAVTPPPPPQSPVLCHRQSCASRQPCVYICRSFHIWEFGSHMMSHVALTAYPVCFCFFRLRYRAVL